jgi:Subtilisin inhibitor-like
MSRVTIVLATAFLLGIASSQPSRFASSAQGSAPPRTALTISYWEHGSASGKKKVWTLGCDPARGTLKRPRRACKDIARGGRGLFAPVEAGAICTEIYGGPQVALITGILDGRRVWTRLQRSGGCEIDRWNRLAPWLLPPGGVLRG